MITLGISSEHCSSAAIFADGRIKGIVQEERLTKRKNQCGFPTLAIAELLEYCLDGKASSIDRVIWAGTVSDPMGAVFDRFSGFSVEDHIREQHELWYPHFYGGRPFSDEYWARELAAGRHKNPNPGFDFSWLPGKSPSEALRYYLDVERPAAVRRVLNRPDIPVDVIDHHTCHAYYAYYGGPLSADQRSRALVLTADGWGDGINWSASVANAQGTLTRIGCGSEHTVARIYKWTTLILGMKPNEHEYKVMGLSSYSRSRKHIEAVERIFYDALDFQEGRFVSRRPLRDSYFDLKNRLEGCRFDNIAAGLQSWASGITSAWARYWLRESKRDVLCFSGGLSMNIKTNGDLAALPEVSFLSVPASGGDESLSVGACFAWSAEQGLPVVPLKHVYFGRNLKVSHHDWTERFAASGLLADDFDVLNDVDDTIAAELLAANCIVARCVGNAEFGARSLGNRAILANPAMRENIALINDMIKNRDFWMPFTPSIQAEHADDYLDNPKHLISPFMTIGFKTKVQRRHEIIAALHPGDASARPQYVDSETNPEYWALIEAFRRISGIPAVLNTSLNLHGEPMNYTVADAARTVGLSELDFLLMPGRRLLYKRRALETLSGVIKKYHRKGKHVLSEKGAP